MELADITPGCRLDIIESVHGGGEKSYPSSLYSVLDEHTIEVTTPLRRSVLIALPVGGRYSFIFTTDKGLLRAGGEVIDRYTRENFSLLKVHVPGSLSRFQRREFYRLDVVMPVVYQVLDEDLIKLKDPAKIETALKDEKYKDYPRGLGSSIDISGGGIKFTSSMDLASVPSLLLKFQLKVHGQTMVMTVTGRVVRSDEIEGTGRYAHRIQFIDPDTSVQERIIRYIFETERLRRQKD